MVFNQLECLSCTKKWKFTPTSNQSGHWSSQMYMRRAFYGGAVQQLSLNSGSPVVYSKVNEFSVDEQGAKKDKTEYIFTIDREYWNTGGFNNWRAFVMYKDHWRGGKDLGKVSSRSNDDGSFTEVYRENKDYQTITNNSTYRFYKILFSHPHLGIGGGIPPEHLLDESYYMKVEFQLHKELIY